MIYVITSELKYKQKLELVFPTCEIIDFPTALTVQALYALAALMTKLLHIISYAVRVTIH